MYDLNSFSYWKNPIVRIKRIGIYPLDDEGKAQYFSKDSFVHHYLKMKIPQEENYEFRNDSEKNINEIQKEPVLVKEQNSKIKNMKSILLKNDKDNKTILQTEPNLESNHLEHPIKFQNKTISNSFHNNFIKKYNMIGNKQKLRLKKINEYQSKSVCKNRHFKNDLFFGKTQNSILNKKTRNVAQSFDKKVGLTGLQILPNRKARVNQKLPLIMEKLRNENGNIIKIIKTGTKEMGESYNPYNFIVPHVNRTKRNIFGSLFHS